MIQECSNWGTDKLIDALTLFCREGRGLGKETVQSENLNFMQEASMLRSVHSKYCVLSDRDVGVRFKKDANMMTRNVLSRLSASVFYTTLAIMLQLTSLSGLAAGRESGLNDYNTLVGFVEGNGVEQTGYSVALYAIKAKRGRFNENLHLGTGITDDTGRFEIRYKLPFRVSQQQKIVFHVVATRDKAMLASAFGAVTQHDRVVVNERTSVAMGTAFAQFIDGDRIRGNAYGILNAAKMAANMANPKTGVIGDVLIRVPNGTETSTYPTFNTIANIVSSCIDAMSNCEALFEKTAPPGGPKPTTVLQAIANMAKYPSQNVSDLFRLANLNPTFYPALATEPTSWLLFIKFTGGSYSRYAASNLMSGPGNIAIDQRGFAWINDNYVPAPQLQISCAGLRLMKFYPWGESFPGSPYFGGGLSGAGFGITLDRHGKIWVGNFGFEAPDCDGSIPPDPDHEIPATHNSLSLFRPTGEPISNSDGMTEGDIWWPQATVSDKKGNIWVANCGNDTVTLIPRGESWLAQNIVLPGGQGAKGNFIVMSPHKPRLKPFAIAIDRTGRAWVTANKAGSGDGRFAAGRVYRISSDGSVERLPDKDKHGFPVLSWPMGISSDSKGNMWVSNSDAVNVPCVTPLDPQRGDGPSIALYAADGGYPVKFEGGGLTIPWGNAIDGNDTLWVFNFGQHPIDRIDEETIWPLTAVSHFCGADESKCPSGLRTGDPISPDTGYASDALDRITGGGIDPSGNLWLMNNWKKTGPFDPVYNTNPGGNSFVIIPGVAAPIKTPLIGPPVSFDRRAGRHHHSDRYKRR